MLQYNGEQINVSYVRIAHLMFTHRTTTRLQAKHDACQQITRKEEGAGQEARGRREGQSEGEARLEIPAEVDARRVRSAVA